MENAIEPLGPTNYETWADDVKVLLLDKGCWKFVLGKETALDKDASSKEIRDNELRKDRAYTTIYLNVSKDYRSLISNTTDGSVAWKTLQEHFQPNTRARVISLLDEFFNCRYEGQEIGLFAAELRRIVSQLRDAGHQPEPMYQAFQLIRYLPDDFKGIVQIIYRWNDKMFTFDNVLSELILEENRLKQSGNDFEKINSSFNAKISVSKVDMGNNCNSTCSNSKTTNEKVNFKKAKNLSKNVKVKKIIGPCFKCGKTGHLMKSCKVSVNKKNNYVTEAHANQSYAKQGNLSWVFDTAASTHFCNNKNLFTTYKPLENTSMSLAVGESPVEGVGTIDMYFGKGKSRQEFTLNNVMYSPHLKRNLMSGPMFDKNGATFVGSKGKIKVYSKHGGILFCALKSNGLYFCKPNYPDNVFKRVTKASSNLITSKNDNVKVWHERFCHVNTKYIVNTSNNESVRGMPKLKHIKLKCEDCIIAKSRRKSFKSIGKIRSTKPLELLHLDVNGPLPVESKTRKKWFLTITDDYSRKVTVYPMREKGEVFEMFTRYQKRAERFLNAKILNIRTDQGMEFCHNKFNRFLESEGIKAERTNTYSPEMNGVSEKYNSTAMDGVKALLKQSGLPDTFWDEALLCFTYVWNRVCHGENDKTPFELYCGRKPSVSHLKRFGCTAYVGTPKQLRNKLSMRAKKGVMLGYALQTKGYRIWVPDDRKVIETINVSFDEELGKVEAVLDPKSKVLVQKPVCSEQSSDDESETEKLTSVPCENINWVRTATPRPDGTRTDIYYGIEGTNTRLRSNNDVEKYCNSNSITFNRQLFNFSGKNTYSGNVKDQGASTSAEACHVEVKIPRNYFETLKSSNKQEWHSAMQDEMQIMKDRDVWDLVPRPENAKVLGNRWVYTLKKNEKNEIVRFKSRLVAQGFTQRKGETYDEVFSPVVNFAIIRLFFSILVCLLGWKHCQLDIKCAYLYANLKEVIFMKQPQGFTDREKPDHVCSLNKAIYGLHQSGRNWFFEINSVLEDLEFKKFEWCNCVYAFKNEILLLLYVDDIVLFSKSEDSMFNVIKKLESHFDIKIIGKTRKLLGVDFEEVDGKLFIHQKEYISKVYETYKDYKIPITSLPIAKGTVLSKLDCPNSESEIKEMSKFPYRNVIGCLAYIASRTRPDISYAVNILSQFQENPGNFHWNSLLKLLGYLNFTKDYKLELSNIGNLNVNCYSDSDFASNRDDRISMGGIILFIDKVPIIWRTFKQKCVSLSTMEAEYITLTDASKELMWIIRILEECRNLSLIKESSLNTLLCDNQAAIDFSNSPIENNRTKHIHVRYHFLRNLIYDNLFELKHVVSKDNLADIFTKPLTKCGLLNFVDQIFVKT